MRFWLLFTFLPALCVALGERSCLSFSTTHDALTLFDNTTGIALPILTDSKDAAGIHIAVATFARDVEWVTGLEPKVYNDTLPKGTERAILVGTVGSRVVKGAGRDELKKKWEAWDARVAAAPREGLKEALMITGSDKRGTIYALYTLSEQMGVSPWYFWADVPVHSHSTISFPRSQSCGHGSPHVRYRGFFINDEAPVLTNWIKHHWHLKTDHANFQTWFYEPLFELLLRLKGNYLWPAMWSEMFNVDGLDVSDGIPKEPIPGPNQILADRMGIVMGASHQEPMGRNTPEWEHYGQGDWNYTVNSEFLDEFWKYGAERAKGLDTLFTVGMRGNGDLPLPGANVAILENITAAQQDILRQVYERKDLRDIPQVWAMYKEVMGYFATGLKVPPDVTPLLADDNWGNLGAVMPWGSNHSAGGGVYYHADYVGDPRNYKWLNTVPLVKMWDQLNIASTFKTTEIWVLNVGDMKMLEVPLEWFMSLAYDSERWSLNSLKEWFVLWAKRNFQMAENDSREVASIMLQYQMMVSRRKPELIDSTTFSLTTYNETERIIDEWRTLEKRPQKLQNSLSEPISIAFYELVHTPIALNANLNELYIAVGKSNLYSTQSKQSASRYAERAIALFKEDQRLTDEFHSILDGKWNYMLAQSHIHYQYWQSPMSNTLPPISYASPWTPSFPTHSPNTYTRITVENSLGAWPGDNRFNCEKGYLCEDPRLFTMDQYGQTRWVEVGSGGPIDIDFNAIPDVPWLRIHPSSGTIKSDGSTDTRCTISIDWEDVPDSYTGETNIVITTTDGTAVNITVPIVKYTPPPTDFTGFVEGDGYVVMEAAHFQHRVPSKLDGVEYAWEELEHYGRTLSGMTLLPAGPQNFTAGTGPVLAYDFWTFTPTKANITFQLGPSLNFILGSFLAFSYSLDGSTSLQINPVPASALGTVPHDWLDVVANEIRNVTIEVDLRVPGRHRLEVGGMTTGVVLERIWVDLGGIQQRGYSYLGPPESVRVVGEEGVPRLVIQ